MWHSYANIQPYKNVVKVFKFLFYLCTCMCLFVYMCSVGHRYPAVAKGGHHTPGTGKTDSCEPLNVLGIQPARAASVITVEPSLGPHL